MRSKIAILIVSASLFLAAMPVLAHHSFAAEYDRTKPIKVTGTVTKFDMTNPHSWVYLDVKDAPRSSESRVHSSSERYPRPTPSAEPATL